MNLQHSHGQGKDKGRESFVKSAESLAILIPDSLYKMNGGCRVGRHRYLACASVSFCTEVMVNIRTFLSLRVEIGAANSSHSLSPPEPHRGILVQVHPAAQTNPILITNGVGVLDLRPEFFPPPVP